MDIKGELLSLWEHTNKTNVSMTLHLCEWKYFLPYDDHILPNMVVKILPSFWKAGLYNYGSHICHLIHLCNTWKGKSLGWYNDDTKQE
jgi:hypothetical protein